MPFLANEGVQYDFGLPSEEIVAVLAVLSRSVQIRSVLLRHEQGTAIVADTYGFVSTDPRVCLATLDRGASNLITGIVHVTLDQVPLGPGVEDLLPLRVRQYRDVLDQRPAYTSFPGGPIRIGYQERDPCIRPAWAGDNPLSWRGRRLNERPPNQGGAAAWPPTAPDRLLSARRPRRAGICARVPRPAPPGQPAAIGPLAGP